jgi:ribose transport system permease protein
MSYVDKADRPALLKSTVSALLRSNFAVGTAIMVLLLIVGSATIPGFLMPRNLLAIGALGMLVTLAALGQTFVVISGDGGIDLSVGAIMSFSAVLGAMIISGQDQYLLPGIIAVCLTGAALGFVNALGIWYLRIPALIMTLGLAGIVAGLSIVITHGQPSGSSGPFLAFLASGDLLGVPMLIIVGVLAAIGAEFVLQRTGFGRMLFLVGSNPSAADVARIPRNLIVFATYTLSGALSGFAGLMLLGYTQTPYLKGGEDYMLSSIAAVVVGGISLKGGQGSVGNTILGAFVLTIIGSILVGLHVAQGGREIIDGIILLCVLALYAVRGRRQVR